MSSATQTAGTGTSDALAVELSDARLDAPWLLAAFLLAAALRFGAAASTLVIAKDGVTWYIEPAQAALAGRLVALVEGDHHPLFPAVMAVMGWIIPDWEIAGKAVNVILGALLVLPCYSFAKTIFGRVNGLYAAFITALMPRFAEYSGDILSEPLAHLLMMTAVALGARWALLFRRRDAVGCGVCAGLAYLARPEGVCVGIALTGWTGLILFAGAAAVWRRRPGLRQALRRAGAALPGIVLCGLIILPYLVYIRQESGHWRLTKTHYLRGIIMGIQDVPAGAMDLDMEEAQVEQEQRREFRWRLWLLSRRFGEANYPFILLMFVGFLVLKGRAANMPAAYYVSAHFWGFFLIYIMFNYASPYALPRRHFIGLGCLAMPWTALGAQALVGFGRRRGSNTHLVRALRGLTWLALLMGLALAFHFAWRPHRIEKVGLRKAGEWIYRAHGRPGARVISLTDPRPAFYAHGRTVALPWLVRGYWDKPREFADFFAAVRRLKPDYLLIQTDSVERGIPDFYEGARKAGLVSIQRFRRSGLEDSIGEVWVYRLSDWWGAEARRGQP